MAVLKVRQNGEWVVVGTGEKGDAGASGKDGAGCYVNGVATNVNFTSDPQTQLDNINSQVSTNTSNIASLGTNKANQSDLSSTNAKVTTLTNDKANKDFSNVTYPTFVADGVERSSSGYTTRMTSDKKTWYIIFPTGLKICHLVIDSIPSTDTPQQVRLPIPFNTTTYMAHIVRSPGSSYLRLDDVGYTDKTTSGFKIRGYNPPVDITCIGY